MISRRSRSPQLLTKGTVVLVAMLAIFGGQMGGPKINLGHILAILVAYAVYQQLKKTQHDQYLEFQNQMDSKLMIIDPQNDFPYLLSDPVLLNLLVIVTPLRKFDEETFLDLIRSANDFLQTSAAIRCPATLNIAAEYSALQKAAGLILNRFHALIYGPNLEIDSSSYLRLYHDALDELRVHLNTETLALRQLIVKSQRLEPVNLGTIFIPSWTAPRPFNDTSEDLVERNFHFFDDP